MNHPIGHRLIRLDEVSSTIDVARSLVEEGAEHGTVVTAARQAAGRGRRGRTWCTLPDTSIALTTILRDLPDTRHRGLAGIAAALSVVDAASQVTGAALETKWPNDVLGDGNKLAGTLAEMHAGALLLSLGLNVNGLETDIPEPIRDRATTLQILIGEPVDQEPVLQALLRTLTRTYHTLLNVPGNLIDVWDALDVTRGREVTLHTADGAQLAGTSRGIDEEGRMRLRMLGGDVRHVGEGDATVGR